MLRALWIVPASNNYQRAVSVPSPGTVRTWRQEAMQGDTTEQDVLTGAHLHLTQNIRRIEQRASQKTCRCFDPCKATAVQPWQGSPIAPTNEVKPMNIRE